MNLTDKKAELERKLKEIKNEIDFINSQIEDCDHEYGETQYDPETVKVPYGSSLEKQGSDIWFGAPKGYREEKRDRWSQTCKKCGHKRYTTQTVPVAFEPKF